MKTSRVSWISFASVISTIAVVMLHTNGCFWQFSTERYWFTANIIESVMYFAVPVFFMISGATLMEYRDRYSTKEYFKKRIAKTVVPFLIWSVIGLLYRLLTHTITIESSAKGISDIVIKILNGQMIAIYWFFPAIFGIYLCMPLFAAVRKELRERLFISLILISFVLNYCLPFICAIWPGIGYANNIPFWIVDDYLIYVLIGYLVSKKEIGAKFRYLSYCLGFLGLLLHICGTYFSSIAAGTIVDTYKGYSNVPCLLYSVGVFIFLKQLGVRIKNEKIINFIELIGKYTFAIYLLHWFVMDMLCRLFEISTYSIVYRVGGAFLIFGICIVVTFVIRKIPVVRNIVPS